MTCRCRPPPGSPPCGDRGHRGPTLRSATASSSVRASIGPSVASRFVGQGRCRWPTSRRTPTPSSLPFTRTVRRSSKSNIVPAASAVASSTSTASGSARCISRAARFTASPITVYTLRDGPPSRPANTVPVPTPIDDPGSDRVRRDAAATARQPSSGLDVGAPKVSSATVPLSPPVIWIVSPPRVEATSTISRSTSGTAARVAASPAANGTWAKSVVTRRWPSIKVVSPRRIRSTVTGWAKRPKSVGPATGSIEAPPAGGDVPAAGARVTTSPGSASPSAATAPSMASPCVRTSSRSGPPPTVTSTVPAAIPIRTAKPNSPIEVVRGSCAPRRFGPALVRRPRRRRTPIRRPTRR